MKRIFLSLGFLFALGLQVATAQTWEDAYAVPNMLGDGGLLQPNSIDNNNFTIYNFQENHCYNFWKYDTIFIKLNSTL